MSTADEPQEVSASRIDALRVLLNKHVRLVSAVAFVLGIAGLLISEFGEIHQLRIFGAGLISAAGIGFGIDTGLADPRKLRVPSWVHSRRAVIGVATTIIAITPVTLALAAILVGLAGDAGHDRDRRRARRRTGRRPVARAGRSPRSAWRGAAVTPDG